MDAFQAIVQGAHAEGEAAGGLGGRQVGGAQDGVVEIEALGEFRGVESFLVGLDDASGTGLGAADGDPAFAGGGVRLLPGTYSEAPVTSQY
ncbi:hypothetical protein QA802_34130 [Streptomyces sp. B21-105]|uniref:hypothetical protein n=1 Tax=Streptomyces sp. B21-105 TaxID=3039417 RepID=UPI002FF36A18